MDMLTHCENYKLKQSEILHFFKLEFNGESRLAIPAISKCLNSDDKEAAKLAVETLEIAGIDSESFIPLLTDLIEKHAVDANQTIFDSVTVAILALGRMGSKAKSAIQLLKRVRDNPNSIVHFPAVCALGIINNDVDASISELVQELKRDSEITDRPFLDLGPLESENCLAQFGNLAVPKLGALLTSKNSKLRVNAVSTLWWMANVQGLLINGGQRVFEKATLVQVEPLLCEALKDKDAEVKCEAMRAIVITNYNIGHVSSETKRLLTETLHDESAKGRLGAIQNVPEIYPKTERGPLIEAFLEDSDCEVRVEAAVKLLHLHYKIVKAVEHLKVDAAEEAKERTKGLFSYSLATSALDSAWFSLSNGLLKAEGDVKMEMLKGLTLLGGKAIPSIKSIAKCLSTEKDPFIREAAINAMRAIILDRNTSKDAKTINMEVTGIEALRRGSQDESELVRKAAQGAMNNVKGLACYSRYEVYRAVDGDIEFNESERSTAIKTVESLSTFQDYVNTLISLLTEVEKESDTEKAVMKLRRIWAITGMVVAVVEDKETVRRSLVGGTNWTAQEHDRITRAFLRIPLPESVEDKDAFLRYNSRFAVQVCDLRQQTSPEADEPQDVTREGNWDAYYSCNNEERRAELALLKSFKTMGEAIDEMEKRLNAIDNAQVEKTSRSCILFSEIAFNLYRRHRRVFKGWTDEELEAARVKVLELAANTTASELERMYRMVAKFKEKTNAK